MKSPDMNRNSNDLYKHNISLEEYGIIDTKINYNFSMYSLKVSPWILLKHSSNSFLDLKPQIAQILFTVDVSLEDKDLAKVTA